VARGHSCSLQDGEAKITDVGMARLMSEAYYTQDASFGTFSWAAPEVLLGEKCSEKVDCYSLGVTCWEIASGLMPIRGQMSAVSEEECPMEVRISCCHPHEATGLGKRVSGLSKSTHAGSE